MKNSNHYIPLILSCLLLLQFTLYSQSQNTFVFYDTESFPNNNLGMQNGSFKVDSATISVQTLKDFDAFWHQGKSLRLGYDVTPAESFSGFVSSFDSLDLTGYQYLSFYVKGGSGGEYFSIELKRTNGESAKVALWNYLPCGPDLDWQKVIIPLDAFWNLTALSGMNEFVIVFDYFSSLTNDSPLVGEVHIDDIVFGSHLPGSVKIDPFGDKINSNATGANNGTFSQTGTEDNYSSEIICPEPSQSNCECFYKINYDNGMEDEFGGAFFILGGDTTGWLGVGKNLSNYDTLYLEVMAETSGTNPGNFKIELVSNVIHSYQLLNITLEKKAFTIPFSAFNPPIGAINKIKAFNIVFENNIQEQASGFVYIDEVEFRAEGYQAPDSIKPLLPQNLTVNGNPVTALLSYGADEDIIITADVENDNSRLEVIRLEYLQACEWYCFDKKYAPFDAAAIEFSLSSNDLPKNVFLEMRMVTENYNGRSCPGESFAITVLPPVVSISTSADSLCEGDELTFEAQLENVVDDFHLDWFVNTTSQNVDNETFTANFSDQGNYSISCVLTFIDSCGMENMIGSNLLDLAVHVYPIAEVSNDSPVCEEDSVQLLASGGITYEWAGNGFSSNDQNPVVYNSGLYTLTITNEFGCSVISSTLVEPFLTIPEVIVNGGVITCENPTIQLDASSSSSGSGGPLSFSWTGPGTIQFGNTATPIVGEPGIYEVTLIDSNNACTNSEQVEVFENTIAPVANAGPEQQIDCLNSTVQLSAANSSGQGTLNFLWSNGEETEIITVNEPGNYEVTVTDNINGCTAIDEVLVIENTIAPIADAGLNQQLDCVNTVIELDGSNSSGQGFLSYVWSNGGETETIIINEPGSYQLTVMDAANGCTAIDEVIVTENTSTPFADAGADMQLDCENATVVLDASNSFGQGMLGYLWSNGEETPTIEVSQAGTYEVTVTEVSNGCTSEDDVVVLESIGAPSADAGLDQQLDCLHLSVELDASNSSGQGMLTFVWSTGEETSTIVVAEMGTYEVTVTDVSNSCVAIDEVVVSENTETPFADAGPDIQVDCSTTTIVLDASNSSGQGMLTFVWSTGEDSVSIEVGEIGIYEVTVTDSANGCTAMDQVMVTKDILPPDISASGGIINCSNLGIQLTGNSMTAGVIYKWEGPDGFNSVEQNPVVFIEGVYTLTVCALNGCSSTETVEVTTALNLLIDFDVSAPSCYDSNNGSAMVLVEGGIPPYIVEWSNGDTTMVINGLAPSNYFVTITDSEGCGSVDSVLVIAPEPIIPLPPISISSDTCLCGAAVAFTGGLAPYTLAWFNLQDILVSNMALPCDLEMDSYYAVITDANGCTAQSEAVSVDCFVSSSNSGYNNFITVYPTLSSNEVFVKVRLEKAQEVRLKLFNSDGVPVGTWDRFGAEFTQRFDVGSLVDGIYFVEVEWQGSVVVNRFVKIGL